MRAGQRERTAPAHPAAPATNWRGFTGRIQITDPLGHAITMAYDGLGRETSEVQSGGVTTTMAYDMAGNLTSTTDPLGHVTSMTYDMRGLPVAETDAYGTAQAATTTTLYDADQRVLSVTDPLGRITSYAYDAVGRATATIGAYGTGLQQTTTMVYDLNGNVLSETNPLGVTTSYGYDVEDRMTQMIEAYGTSLQRITTYAYDDNDNQTLVQDPLGIKTTMAYDALNRVTSTTQGSGYTGPGGVTTRTTSETYDAAGNLLSEMDGRGLVTSYGYDSDNRQTQLIEAYGTSLQRITTTVYDKAGNVLYVTDPLGIITSYGYDALNRQTTMIEAKGTTQARTTVTTYDAGSNVLSVTNGAGEITSYVYDALNRQTQRIEDPHALAQTTNTVYDADGEVLSVTDPLGTITSYAYDALGRETQTILAYNTSLAETVNTGYDAGGDVTTVTDAGGFITTMAYDALQRRTKVQDPGGGVTTTLYDADNNVTGSIDPNGNRTTYGFDSLRRETTITDARGGVTTMVFDLDDNEVNLIDPVGNKTTFSFDSLNRETAMTDPLGASATYAYDAGSRQTSATDRDGRVITTSYDPLYRVTAQTWTSGGSTVNRLTFTYDAADNQLTAADFSGAYTLGYDALNRMTSEQEPFGLLLTFGYDSNDNRTVVQDSFGGVLTSLYDALDRFTSRQFGGVSQTPLRFDLTYNSRNDISTVTRYSDLAGSNKVGYSTYSCDAADRVTNIQHQNGTGSVLANFTYSYDPGSRLQSEKADGSTRTFQYDPTNELTSDGLFSYSYDLNGNRTMTGYTTGTGNELTGDGTWTYAYDGEGNTISKRNTSTGEVWSYGYDNENRMLTAKDVSGTGTTMTLATYSYDALGNRLESDVWTNGNGTTVTRFGYDGDQVWADLTSSNALQTRYLRGDEADQLFARITGAGVAAWYLTGWEGSVRKLTDGSGTLQDTITYDGFGNIHSETNSTAGGAYKFDGMRFDAETGDYSTWARTDAPSVGRWLQQDPLGFKAGDANLYRYAHNQPSGRTDATGLDDDIVHLGESDWTDFVVTAHDGNIVENHVRGLGDVGYAPYVTLVQGKDKTDRGVAFWVESNSGPATDYLFVQFVWMTVKVHEWHSVYPPITCGAWSGPLVKQESHYLALSNLPVNTGTESLDLTTDPKHPHVGVDSYAKQRGYPYYNGPGHNDSGKIALIVDRPQPEALAEDAVKAASESGTMDRGTATMHFDTYLLKNQKPVFHWAWHAWSDFNVAYTGWGRVEATHVTPVRYTLDYHGTAMGNLAAYLDILKEQGLQNSVLPPDE